MRIFSLSLFTLVTSSVFAQGPIVTPLNGNALLKKAALKSSVSKRQSGDTLALPFMDDFNNDGIFPDSRIWMDSQAYVNSHFPVSPPSYGVATLDNLDKKGRPYQTLSGLTHNHCDSLTSNAINLKNYKSGLNNIDYTLSDSIYLSFFYQTQGLGDPLDNSDSLVLMFRNNSGAWNTVWKTPGTAIKPFKQILVGIKDNSYLFKGFQFRFINYSKSTGNMNQWHLDYVRMAANRGFKDTLIQDVAFNKIPRNLLYEYESMPYDHFLSNVPFYQSPNGHMAYLRNNNPNSVNTTFSFQAYNRYNQLIGNLPVGSSSRNILALSDSSEEFLGFRMDTLSGKNPYLRIKYNIYPQANDLTAGTYGSLKTNNEIERRIQFGNEFAYDDGTAEGGYGLDYGSLPSGPGYAAIKFSTSKSDTIRGLSVYFNRSVADVSSRSFYLMVWTRLSEPPANNTKNDVVARKVYVEAPVYSDSINGFVQFVFDTAVAIPAGDFYIGWQQSANFILNVGYDNNYKFRQSNGRNPNLFYNLNGYWEAANPNITGAVMMRPIVGAPIPKKTGIQEITNPVAKIKVYPNPSGSSDRMNISSETSIESVKIFDICGKLLIEKNEDNILTVDVSGIQPGMYWIEIRDSQNDIHKVKYIISR